MTWVTAPVARAGNEGLSGMDAQFGALTVPFRQDHGCARMGGSCAEEGLKSGESVRETWRGVCKTPLS